MGKITGFHEDFSRREEETGSSERSFGFVFAGVLFIVALCPLLDGGPKAVAHRAWIRFGHMPWSLFRTDAFAASDRRIRQRTTRASFDGVLFGVARWEDFAARRSI